MAIGKPKVRRINVDGKLSPGVYAKDVILHIIRKLGVNGGIGYAYEYGGSTFDAFSQEERMTVCNMSIEGGARVGYVNPDETTFEYLRGRPYSPTGAEWDAAVARWKAVASDKDAVYDDIVNFRAEEILPTVTWGITPGQAVFIDEAIPDPKDLPEKDRDTAAEAIEHMKLPAGTPAVGIKIDVAFLGSCTNGRLSDLQEVAKHIRGRKVSSQVKAIVVPGSQGVASIAEKMGLAEIFREAGFEWRGAGCSMCLGMNPDKLVGDQLCASSSNRNFKGRQGSPTGRTMLMSPLMVAAAALTGEVSDARKVFGIQ
jgi:3-isopropylmalate/(R)-2-methylmalate dehydratase large subunit